MDYRGDMVTGVGDSKLGNNFFEPGNISVSSTHVSAGRDVASYDLFISYPSLSRQPWTHPSSIRSPWRIFGGAHSLDGTDKILMFSLIIGGALLLTPFDRAKALWRAMTPARRLVAGAVALMGIALTVREFIQSFSEETSSDLWEKFLSSVSDASKIDLIRELEKKGDNDAVKNLVSIFSLRESSNDVKRETAKSLDQILRRKDLWENLKKEEDRLKSHLILLEISQYPTANNTREVLKLRNTKWDNIPLYNGEHHSDVNAMLARMAKENPLDVFSVILDLDSLERAKKV